jgi:hypothetical protein
MVRCCLLCRQALKEYSNWPTYPQLYVDGELVGGCDIVLEMQQTGELQQLIKEKAPAALQPPKQQQQVGSSAVVGVSQAPIQFCWEQRGWRGGWWLLTAARWEAFGGTQVGLAAAKASGRVHMGEIHLQRVITCGTLDSANW